MQALYAHFQSGHDLHKGEKDLFQSIDKFYDTYLTILLFLTELNEAARLNAYEATQRYFPSQKIADTSQRFINNPVLLQLSRNRDFLTKTKLRKISWQKDIELVRKSFAQLKKSDDYTKYLENPDTSFEADQEFVTWLVKKFISASDLFNHYLEERNIYWNDDKEFLISMVAKTVKMFAEEEDESLKLLTVLKDEDDDRDFVQELYRQTVLHNEEYEKSIAEKTKNWDVERIALTDIILMKMSLTEILFFSSIPIKVSINEYIDISKDYSTPKSKVFINGIVDSIVNDYKAENKIRKTGRGLIE
jgi:transcription antitermination protein NusB